MMSDLPGKNAVVPTQGCAFNPATIQVPWFGHFVDRSTPRVRQQIPSKTNVPICSYTLKIYYNRPLNEPGDRLVALTQVEPISPRLHTFLPLPRLLFLPAVTGAEKGLCD